MDRDRLGSWKPRERVGRLGGWLLLVLSTATILTNAYYLQFLEPTLSRKTLALGIVAVTGLWFLVGRFGLPRDRTEVLELWARGRTPVVLALILAVAFSLRYAGAGSGLPQSYIPDEYDYVHSYLVMIKRGDMNPRWWHHPSIQPYVNVAAYLVAYYSQASSGRWPRIHDLQVEDALLWGRVAAGVIPGTLAVLAAFFLGRRMFGTTVGLIASALLAVAPGVVETSQYNKPDSLLVLFCTLSVLTTLVYLDRGGARLAFAAGAVVGLAVAVKYNAALVLLPFLVAVLFRQAEELAGGLVVESDRGGLEARRPQGSHPLAGVLFRHGLKRQDQAHLPFQVLQEPGGGREVNSGRAFAEPLIPQPETEPRQGGGVGCLQLLCGTLR